LSDRGTILVFLDDHGQLDELVVPSTTESFLDELLVTANLFL
jgi:hypothetical protein